MAGLSERIVARRIQAVLAALLADEPVIALHGPRSVGKSTLLQSFASEHGVEVVDLDDPAVLDPTSTRRHFSRYPVVFTGATA